MGVFDFLSAAARKLNNYVTKNTENVMDDKSFLEREIMNWKASQQRTEALQGFLYYEGYHDILYKKRMAIGRGGELTEVTNLPNRKDIDNQYAIAVDKKANYFLGKPIAFEGENEQYIELLQGIFDKRMMKKLKNTAKKSMNGAIAWMFPYYDASGQLKFKVFPAYECMAMWKDADHEELNALVRVYPVDIYENGQKRTIEKVEQYKLDGVYRYIFKDNTLTPDTEAGKYESYISLNGLPYNWERIPVIAFKYNDNEIPLIRRVKPLQDAINELMSMFHNNMLEDNRNTILIIENYDGTDLGEFRQNLSQYGAVKVRSGDGARGGVSTLSVEVNATTYQAILEVLKQALIENAKSFDGKELKSGTPNQLNIRSFYMDLDVDTNDFENEYQAALEELLYFINVHLSLTGQGDFFNEKVNIIFNRDTLMDETNTMAMLISAGVKISNRTLLSQVPFIDDIDQELEYIKEEQEEAMQEYQNAFPQQQPGKEVVEDGTE